MAGFDEEEVFVPIWAKIKGGELKTAHQLRIILESYGEKYEVTTLNMLLLFREWLLEQDIDLSTANGEVTFTKVQRE